ncbi:MAG: radical SAM protein [Alphaproteobacteria bacterium]|nr:radical SAM protein [Alphaproteobacteria bacterium]MBF0249718.1 radical SAM protein [Alphaproteobacteria bacterium]
MSAFRVLLVYPSLYMQTGFPLAIACLAGMLKAHDIQVKVFAPYRYKMEGDFDQNELRSDTLKSTIPVDYSKKGVTPLDPEVKVTEDLTALIKNFQPNLVGMSAVESVFGRGVELMEHAKTVTDVPTIAGGVFPTLAPEVAIQEQSLDMICVGEGESALLELCQRMMAGETYDDVEGLWVKTADGVVQNKRRLENLETLPPPDFSVIDDGMLLRPMRGNLFRTIPVEFSRGCPYKCSFCAEPKLEEIFEKQNDTGFFRKRSIKHILESLKRDLALYSPEFFYFNSETFLAMSNREFDEFIEGYKDIRIPFWIQTRPETLRRHYIERLKEVGMYWLSVGVEHGDQDFRRDVVRRGTKDDVIYEVFQLLDECEQGASANMILGFPFETKDLVYQTIKFSREVVRINPRSRLTISAFAPFRGCELYDVAAENGFLDPSIPYISETNLSKPGILKLPELSELELEGLYRTFPLYVHFPDEFQALVRMAEEFTPEGDKIYKKLSSMFDGFINRPLEEQRHVKSLKETDGCLVALMTEGERERLGIRSVTVDELFAS